MPQNNRIFYAVHYIAIAPLGVQQFTASHVVHGVQSVGITTTFNLEQIFELGQLSLYENIENIPDIEVTATKVLDGNKLLYHAATPGASTDTLTGRSTQRCMFGLAVFNDTNTFAAGQPVAECVVSGAYCSSIAYEFPVEGSCTETIGLVANDKNWFAPGTRLSGFFDGNDVPIANLFITGSGGVQRREDVVFQFAGATGVTLDSNGTPRAFLQGQKFGSVMPRQIPGINASGVNIFDGVSFAAHIGRISVSTNLGREALNELGRRSPYFRFVTFPIQVTCDIEVISSQGDNISATEVGTLGNGNNLQSESIRISTRDGTFIDLGLQNKLASVTYNGGDTSGGNVSTVYSYSNFNDLIVSHPRSNA